MTKAELKRVVKEILTLPTAPFHEARVIEAIEEAAVKTGMNCVVDDFGNRVVVYKPKGKAKKGRIGFVAHTDHPGFEIVSSKGKKAKARWFGGVKRDFFSKAKVLVHDGEGVKGVVTKTFTDDPAKKSALPKSAKYKPRVPLRVSEMDLTLEREVAEGSFGQWDLIDYKLEKNGRIHTRAADDLCSVAAMVALMKELKEKNVRHEVWLIFTRAEEVGFTGAMALLTQNILPSDLITISLETSKILPEATQGKGAVIRLGDRKLTYTPAVLAYMEDCAVKAGKHYRAFKYQRRVMDGGVCEATAFTAAGYASGGIAFPLGNYHNMGDEPDKNGKPVLKAETVHIDDIHNGIRLMLEMAENLGEYPKVMSNLEKRLLQSNRPKFKKLKETLP